jgi:hypothetical protein
VVSKHKVHIYKSTTVYVPSSELGLSPPLLSPATVPLPPNQGGGGRRARGWGSPNSDDWRKSLALCLLCVSKDLFSVDIEVVLTTVDVRKLSREKSTKQTISMRKLSRE